MSLSNFEIGQILGKGSFGSVCLVTRKLDRQIYAMKVVNLKDSPKSEIEAALNEIRLLASLSHPNIIGYKETFYDNPSKTLNIVMEFADGGDLAKKIDYNKKHRCCFDENIIWDWIFQLLNGLTYLHSHQIIHRDLKSANVFLMKNGVLKIGDLNVSKLSKNDYARTKTGTPFYLAPEVWEDRPYDYKCDIWSLGCIIYELCTMSPPFRGTNFKNLYQNIKKGEYNPIPREYSNDMNQIIRMMLIPNPNKRYSAKELLDSNIIKNRIKNNSRKDIIEKINNAKSKYSLLSTIKMPRNIKDINRVLPHERYQMGENDPYETMKKTIKFMENKNLNKNNINIEPLNNYDRNLANQRKNNQNNLINNHNIINNNQNNNNIYDNKPIIIKNEEKLNRKEYGIFNNNNIQKNNDPRKMSNNNNQNNQKIFVKEIRIKNNDENIKKSPNNSNNNNQNQQISTNTQKRKEQKEQFAKIKNEFKINNVQSNKYKKNLNVKQQKISERKQKRLPSSQPKNINIIPNGRNKNDNNNLNKNFNNMNNIMNNKNFGNYNNNNNNNNIINQKNIKRPASQYHNRLNVNNNQNRNNNKNNINNNKHHHHHPIRKYEIKNHNYHYKGQNFDMNPYKRDNKANYGKLDINQYKENNKIKFNNYLHNGGRINNNNKINSNRQRANPLIKQNNNREGKFRK